MKTAASQRSAGFTLMEVIVTILIMAGIMVSITQILTAVRNTRDRIHNMQEAHLAGPAVLDRIEGDLRALDFFERDPSLALRVKNRVLQGMDADSIDFVATNDSAVIEKQSSADRFVRADRNEVGYRLRANPSQDDFLELWRREDFGIDEEPFDGGNFSFLHERIKGFNIEVFEEDGPDGEPLESWGVEGDGTSGIPARIEIELTLELAPRLVRETLIPTKREVTFRRIYRFPSTLMLAETVQPVLFIPSVTPPVPDTGAPDGMQPGLDPGAGGDGTGDDGSGQGGTGNPFGGGGGTGGDGGLGTLTGG
jgi:prepilin-type N-terminal cleavage/methylation domain-containing protein